MLRLVHLLSASVIIMIFLACSGRGEMVTQTGPVIWKSVELGEDNVLSVKASAPEGLVPALFNEEMRLHYIFKNSQIPSIYDPGRPTSMVFPDTDTVHESENIDFSVRIPQETLVITNGYADVIPYDVKDVRLCYIESACKGERCHDWRNWYCHRVIDE